MQIQAWGPTHENYAYICVADQTPESIKDYLNKEEKDQAYEIKWSAEVDNWCEGMILYHEWQGWEPYTPFDDETGIYKMALKKMGLENKSEYLKVLNKLNC